MIPVPAAAARNTSTAAANDTIMDEVKDFANKFVKLTIAKADMQVYKHLHDYMKKYAQKLQRESNDVKQRLAKLEKKGISSGSEYGKLYSRSNILTFQIQKAERLKLEFLRRATELCDSCEDPLKEVQDLYDRLTK